MLNKHRWNSTRFHSITSQYSQSICCALKLPDKVGIRRPTTTIVRWNPFDLISAAIKRSKWLPMLSDRRSVLPDAVQSGPLNSLAQSILQQLVSAELRVWQPEFELPIAVDSWPIWLTVALSLKNLNFSVIRNLFEIYFRISKVHFSLLLSATSTMCSPQTVWACTRHHGGDFETFERWMASYRYHF